MKKETARGLVAHYNSLKPIIKKRLSEFKSAWQNGTEKDIFAELCFCLCTPQSKAKLAAIAIERLKKSGGLFEGGPKKIRRYIDGVRFPNNKSTYIYLARKFFSSNKTICIKKHIDTDDIFSCRKWLVKNIKGMGFKEASHFLRNIGFGKDLAILDKHILKNLAAFDVIKNVPDTISEKTYYRIEADFKKFAKKIGINVDELDLVLWSKETGEVFK